MDEAEVEAGAEAAAGPSSGGPAAREASGAVREVASAAADGAAGAGPAGKGRAARADRQLTPRRRQGQGGASEALTRRLTM